MALRGASRVGRMMTALSVPRPESRLYCDLTQSWSEVGGGVRTYLLRKRQHILDRTRHRHLLIIPGPADEVIEDGRSITVRIASPRIPGSPNYRLMLRNRAVRSALDAFGPDLIECQDAYNLPWAAIGYRNANPATSLVACYMTDFPTVYVQRPLEPLIGKTAASMLSRAGYNYLRKLYNRFDATSALSEAGGAEKLRSIGVDRVEVMPLGVETGAFSPSRRDPELRRELGLADDEPLLIYAGRLDGEKKPDLVVDAFRRLPDHLGARLVLLGEGPLRQEIAALGDARILTPGYVSGRDELARWLASADLYVSGMADETFGVSIVEAQASGLGVVGVAAGAMIDRVHPAIGRIGPVGDPAAMARNILDMLALDRSAVSKAARDEAQRYSWDNSMRILFERIYPAALARTGDSLDEAPEGAALAA